VEQCEKTEREKSRVYDAIYHDNTIYALHFFNSTLVGKTQEDVYCLHASADNGETFSTRSILPFKTDGRGYGTMEFLHDVRLIVYIYNAKDEHNLDYVTSSDLGRTWSRVGHSYFDRKIRNPHIASLGDCYFLHGRSGQQGKNSGNLVLYTSRDVITWDRGIYLRMKEAGIGAYSNNLVTGRFNPSEPRRLLIQSSHAY